MWGGGSVVGSSSSKYTRCTVDIPFWEYLRNNQVLLNESANIGVLGKKR
jgi:hypothetical protein